MTPHPPIRPNVQPPEPEPSILEAVADAVLSGVAEAPWWATMIVALVVLGLGVVALVWALRAAGRLAVTARQSLARAATADPERRARAGVWVRQRAMTLLFAVVVAIVVGLSAQTLVGWLVSVGMSPWWARLAFVAYDGMAIVLALTLWRRVERGERAGLLRLAVWAIVGTAAWLNSHHAPSGEPAAAVAYAAFPILAAVGLEVLLQEQRRDRSFLRRQAGEEASRRVAAVRWLHPIERVRVALMLASDEHLGADAATREVRLENAARAVFRLRRGYVRGPVGRLLMLGLLRSERRAQAALARAGTAVDQEAMLEVLRRVQVLAQAQRIAGLNYSDAAQAAGIVSDLITAESLTAPASVHTLDVDPEVSVSGEVDDRADEPWPGEEEWERLIAEAPRALTDVPQERDRTDEGVDEGASELEEAPLIEPEQETAPASESERPIERPQPVSTSASAKANARRERAYRLWLADQSLTGAALARETGASAATGSRWRREFEAEHKVKPSDRSPEDGGEREEATPEGEFARQLPPGVRLKRWKAAH